MSEGLLIIVAFLALALVVLTLKMRARQRAFDEVVRTLGEQQSLAQLGMMMAGIAHEMNTPLGAINCCLDTRRRAMEHIAREVEAMSAGGQPQLGTEKLEKALGAFAGTDEMLDTALARTGDIVRHMRLAGRGEQDQRETVDLNDVVAGAVVLLHNELKHGIDLQLDLGEEAVVRASTTTLGSIVINLLHNAAQAQQGQGRITVTTRRSAGTATLVVADAGPGFPATDSERIFDPGFTTKDKEQGTGLGLFISRKLAVDNGGTLTAAVEPAGGAVFTLTLPAVAD